MQHHRPGPEHPCRGAVRIDLLKQGRGSIAATLRHLESRAFTLIVSRCKCVVDRIIKGTDATFLEIGPPNGRHKPAKTAACRVIILKAAGPLQPLADIWIANRFLPVFQTSVPYRHAILLTSLNNHYADHRVDQNLELVCAVVL